MRANALRTMTRSFIAGFCTCWLVGFALFKACGAASFSEGARITSPDGRFDAVEVFESYGGAAGGYVCYVYIVSKGRSAPLEEKSNIRPVFAAEEISGQRIAWRQAR